MVTHADRSADMIVEPVRPNGTRRKLSLPARTFLISVAIAIAMGFAVARGLDPEVSGIGTHRQLGLSECPTLARTGMPCPTCGMTTAIAWLTSGHLVQAWSTKPAAVFLAFGAAAIAIWAAASGWCGKIIGFTSGDQALAWWACGSFAIALACWTIRLQQWTDVAIR